MDTAIFSRVLYQLSYLGKSILLLSVRDFTLGVGDCQAKDFIRAERSIAKTKRRLSLDLNLLRHYNPYLL